MAWQRDGYEMFGQLMSSIDDDYVKIVMHAQVQVLEQAQPSEDGHAGRRPVPGRRRPGPGQPPACSGPWPPARHPARRSSSPPTGRNGQAPGGAGCGPRLAPRRRRAEIDEAGRSRDSAFDRVGRNDPCPCGSGKKFKFCHGR